MTYKSSKEQMIVKVTTKEIQKKKRKKPAKCT